MSGPYPPRPTQPDPAASAIGILLGIAAAAGIAYALSRIFGGDKERCPFCGAFVSEDSSRCSNCGRKF